MGFGAEGNNSKLIRRCFGLGVNHMRLYICSNVLDDIEGNAGDVQGIGGA